MQRLLAYIQNCLKNASHLMLVVPAGSIILSWSPNTESDLMGYRVYIGTESGNYQSVINVGRETSYQFTDTEDNRSYYFVVTAFDSSGNESVFSDEVSATIEGSGPPPPPPASGNDEDGAYNFPNPFIAGEQSTRIRYMLPESSPVSIAIYNVNNDLVRQLVLETQMPAGERTETVWDGRDDIGQVVANGVYYCQIVSQDFTRIIKIAVLRQQNP